MTIRYELKQIPDPSHPFQAETPHWTLSRVFDTGGTYFDEETGTKRMLGLRTIVPDHLWNENQEVLENLKARNISRPNWLIKSAISLDHHIVPIKTTKIVVNKGRPHKLCTVIFLAMTEDEIREHHPELLK